MDDQDPDKTFDGNITDAFQIKDQLQGDEKIIFE
jgi:hypothetical protein